MSQTPIRRSDRQVKPTFLNDWVVKTSKSNTYRYISLNEQETNDKLKNQKLFKKSESSEKLKNEYLNKLAESNGNSSNPENTINLISGKKLTRNCQRLSINKRSPIKSTRFDQSNILSTKSKKSIASSMLLKNQTQSNNQFTEAIQSPLKRTSKTKKSPYKSQKISDESTSELLKATIQDTSTQKSYQIDEQLKKNAKKKKRKQDECINEGSNNEFKCSKCDQVFRNQELAKKHILTVHYGLARLNDTNNEFSEREIISGYKAAIDLLKTLKCFLCKKAFSSALGLKFHMEICGKKEEDLKRRCDLCGNILKFSSMKSHMEMHQRKQEIIKQATLRKADESNETQSSCNLLDRPMRKSAKKAKEFLKSAANNDDDSDQEQKIVNKRCKKSIDNHTDFNISDTDEECSNKSFGSNDIYSFSSNSSISNLNISTERSFLLLKLWKEHINLPEDLINLIEKSIGSSHFSCNFCKKTFADKENLEFHYLKCDSTLDFNWSCKLCDLKSVSNLILLLKHLIDKHINQINEIPIQLINSMITKKTKGNSHTNIYPSYVNDTERFHDQYFKVKVYEEWIPNEYSIDFLDKKELEHYLPERKISPKFKFKELNDNDNNEDLNYIENNNALNKDNKQLDNWKTLNLFESYLNRHHITIYTGGPIYSAAWCPLPNSEIFENLDQILCLTTIVKNKTYNVFDCDPSPGCLQFWNFGSLKYDSTSANNGSTFIKPKLEFIIVHNYGIISEMVWCPGGTSYIPKQDGKLIGRLGLLALACTDGYVRILSIPLIENVNTQSNNELKAFKLEPIVILEKHPICLSLFNKPTICKSLSWSQTDEQRHIVVGYGNGLISIFDLKTNSSLLKKVNSKIDTIELKPIKILIAHGACVNSVKWLPLPDFSCIVSAGFDRYVKIWSLNDMVSNIVLPKKTVITNVQWSSKYTGCYFSSDDCYSNLHNNVTFRDLTSGNFSNSLSRHKCCVWDFDISEWNSTQIGVDASGEVILSVYAKPKNGKKYNKTRPYECLPVYRLTYESFIYGEQMNQTKTLINKGKILTNVNYLIDQEKPVKSTLDEIVDSYGLVFNDVDLSLYSKIPLSEFERLKAPENMNYPRLGDYPLISLNKVQFNPNKTSHNYVFTGGESGLSRISYIEFLNNPSFSIKS